MKPASAGAEGPNWRDRIEEVGPAPAGGALVRATGVPVGEVLRQLAGGASPEEVLRRHAGLTEEDVRACLAYAAERGGPAAPAGRVAIPGYEVLEELGRGGTAVVYRARQVKRDRVVALKVLLAGEPAGPELVARFQREAEAVTRLQHPHVVQVYEVGEHEGRLFLALEHVAGGSLASRLGAEPWPAQEAAGLVEVLAEAVQAAHEQGAVHGDLKPENVLLTEAGVPKITDFGLARVLRRQGPVAPERAAGTEDVYGLGAILYRLLTGGPPFEGPSRRAGGDVSSGGPPPAGGSRAPDPLAQPEQDPVPVRHLNEDVPRDLESIAMKCLAKDPGRRYAGAKDLADDLRRFLDGEPVKARPAGWAARLWRWARGRPAWPPGAGST